MGRDIGRHSDGDAGCPVYQKVRKSGREHSGLFFRLIKVRLEIHCIFVDVRRHLHGNLTQARFGISHGSGAVAVYGTEVSVTVHEGIAGRPLLCEIYESPVDRAVSVGVIFTHRITDNTRTFAVRLVWTVVQFDHGVEYPSLYRLQTVPHIRQGAGCDNAHGIVDIRFLHRLFQVDFVNFIKNIVFHVLSPLIILSNASLPVRLPTENQANLSSVFPHPFRRPL